MVPLVTCRAEIAAQEDCARTFYATPLDVTRMEDLFRVDIVARVFFEGLEEGTRLIREKECMAEVSGSFCEQIPKIARGHNPCSEFKNYNRFMIDQIGLYLDPRKDCSLGNARWEIPVEILNNSMRIRTTVIQEYRLEDRYLRIFKAGCLLFEGGIDQ